MLAALTEGGLAWLTAVGFMSPAIAAPLAKMAVITLVGYGLWQNRQLGSIRLAALGLGLNALAMSANGGQMPVSPEALEKAGLEDFLRFMQTSSDAVHVLVGPDTKMSFLCDIIPLPLFKKVISPGDALLFVAVLLFLPETTQRIIQHRKEAA